MRAGTVELCPGWQGQPGSWQWEGMELTVSRSPRPGEQLLHSVAKEGAEWKRKKVGHTNLAVSSNNRKPQLCAHRGKQAHTEHTPVPCRDACQTGFIDSLNRGG